MSGWQANESISLYRQDPTHIFSPTESTTTTTTPHLFTDKTPYVSSWISPVSLLQRWRRTTHDTSLLSSRRLARTTAARSMSAVLAALPVLAIAILAVLAILGVLSVLGVLAVLGVAIAVLGVAVAILVIAVAVAAAAIATAAAVPAVSAAVLAVAPRSRTASHHTTHTYTSQ